MQSPDGLDELHAALSAAGVQSLLFHDCIHIPLQFLEGHMEIRAPLGEERSAQIFRDPISIALPLGPCECTNDPEGCAKHLLFQLSQRGLAACGTPA